MPYLHPSLQNRKPIKAWNEERQRRLFEKQFHSEDFVAWVHRHACSIPGCDRGPIECAHAVTCGSGGTWADVLPLCKAHHREQHDIGIQTFSAKYGIDMPALALETADRWLKHSAED